MSELSKLLKRQLKKLNLSEGPPSSKDEWEKFLEAVNKAYNDYEEGRYLLERALSISSDEIRGAAEKQNETNIQLVQASKLASLGTLASGIAHELNNPLAGIRGHAELLSTSTNLTENEKNRADRIVNLTERMAGIVKHLLKLARKPTELNLANIDLQTILADCTELSGSQLKYENIRFNIDLPDSFPMVTGDTHRLISVFQNLLNNSSDEYMREGQVHLDDPEIRIYWDTDKSDENSVVVVVEDRAGGIPKDKLDKIFDPFFTTKDVGTGTGLGLTLARKMVQEVDGDLWVESSPPKTQFFIRLKRGVEDKDAKGTQRASSIKKAAHGQFMRLPQSKKDVLIVDDETDILDILAHRFRHVFNVTTTDSPVQAVQLLEDQKFDLLITDLKMPNLPGDALVELAQISNPQMAICMISGHAQAACGALANPSFKKVVLIEKPFPKHDDMMELVQKAFDLAGQDQEPTEEAS